MGVRSDLAAAARVAMERAQLNGHQKARERTRQAMQTDRARRLQRHDDGDEVLWRGRSMHATTGEGGGSGTAAGKEADQCDPGDPQDVTDGGGGSGGSGGSGGDLGGGASGDFPGGAGGGGGADPQLTAKMDREYARNGEPLYVSKKEEMSDACWRQVFSFL